MKYSVLATILLLLAPGVFAQGTVTFANRIAGTGTTHVFAPNGELIGTHGLTGQFGAATTLAQLLGAPGSNAPESSLMSQIGAPVSFRTGAAAGNIIGSTATFNNIPPDAALGSFEMVVWDNSSGLYPTWAEASIVVNARLIPAGKSGEFVIQSIGGTVNTPPNLFPGLTDVHLTWPEPSTPTLLFLGVVLLTIRGGRHNSDFAPQQRKTGRAQNSQR